MAVAEPSILAAQARKQSGDALQREGSYGEAVMAYGEALDALADLKTSEAAIVLAGCQVNLARCRSKLGDHHLAIEACTAAMTADIPRSLRSAALYRRALALNEIGDDTRALDDATAAVALGEVRSFICHDMILPL